MYLNARGARAEVVGQFYMTSNEWLVDYAAGVRGKNLKGMVVYKDLRMVNFGATDPALCCSIPPTSSNGASYIAPIGVLLDDMILGKNPLTEVWVNVLMLGHCDRILTAGAAGVASTDHVLFSNGTESGFVAGCSFDEYTTASYLTLSGAVLIETAAASAAVNLNGVDIPGSSTWLGPPRTVITPGGGAPTKAAMVIGYHYTGDEPRVPQEVADGLVVGGSTLYRQVRGWVNCMGAIHSW